MKIWRDILFHFIDGIIPRAVAAIHYKAAYNSLFITFSSHPNIEIWFRNSFEKGNFVFGVSDLDLTILLKKPATKEELTYIRRVLHDHKKLYPFLGEINLYQEGWLDIFAPTLNYYERLRDSKISKRMQEISLKDMNVDKVVFILRNFYTDRVKLKTHPTLRQKKWRAHFQEMNLNVPEMIGIKELCNALKNILNLEEENWTKVLKAVKSGISVELNEENIFSTSLPEYWKYLFPHKYLWFESKREEAIKIRGTFLASVCLRQIEWEIWGIMSQIMFLKSDGINIEIHLLRLKNLVEIIDEKSKIPEDIDRLLEIVESLEV